MLRCCYFFAYFPACFVRKKKLERKTSLISILGKVQLYRRSVYLPVSRLHRLHFFPRYFSAGVNPAAMHRGRASASSAARVSFITPYFRCLMPSSSLRGQRRPTTENPTKLSCPRILCVTPLLHIVRWGKIVTLNKEMGCIVRALSVNPAPHHHLPRRFEYFGFQF